MTNETLKLIKKNNDAIALFEGQVKILKKEVAALNAIIVEKRKANQEMCSHPNESVVDEGGQFGSVCTCTICGHLVSCSG